MTAPGLVRRPTTAGLVLVALVLALGLLSSLTGSHWLTAAAAAPLALGVASVLAGAVAATRLHSLRAAVLGPHRTAVGETVVHTLWLQLPASRSAWALVVHVHQDGLEPREVVLHPDEARDEVKVTLNRAALQRSSSGALRLEVLSSDVLGLFRWTAVLDVPCPVVVRPRRARPAPLPLSVGGQPDGSRPVPARTGDLAGVRAWQRGDRAADVHRRATARTGSPVVVVREETGTAVRAAVVLVGAVRDEHDEQRLAVCAATAAHLRSLTPTAPVLCVHRGGVAVAPAGPPSVVLDWWAALATSREPGPLDPGAVLAAVPRGTDVVLAVGTGVLAGAGWPDLDAAAAARGTTVRWVR